MPPFYLTVLTRVLTLHPNYLSRWGKHASTFVLSIRAASSSSQSPITHRISLILRVPPPRLRWLAMSECDASYFCPISSHPPSPRRDLRRHRGQHLHVCDCTFRWLRMKCQMPHFLPTAEPARVRVCVPPVSEFPSVGTNDNGGLACIEFSPISIW